VSGRLSQEDLDRMRILLWSQWFAPSIGGVETISRILAEEFARQGCAVTVATHTPGPAMDLPYAVVRQPSAGEIRRLVRAHDVFFQNTISLRTLVPAMGLGRPVVVAHASWLRRGDGSRGVENYLKLLAVRACHNVAISRAIAAELPVPSVVIGNPFEAEAFAGLRETPRDRDIVFMGRLIGEKGCDVLLRAMAGLRERGLTPTATIIGDGVDMPALQQLAAELGVAEQVEFTGTLREGRGQLVARHRIMAVPSRWSEPFGVVALEGIAAGCALVVSERGGLPDAAGPCGLYFPNGDVPALTEALARLLTDDALRQQLVDAGPEHLKQFEPSAVARQYLDLFHSIRTA
jgi:glycosyltransferase involved in cell wall biosynthesis